MVYQQINFFLSQISDPSTDIETSMNASWLPMIVIDLAQIQIAFTVSALLVSVRAIIEEFDTSHICLHKRRW